MIFLAFVWMFVLGIFVGRGTAPVNFTIEKLQKEIIALKEENKQEEKEKLKLYMESAQKKTNMGFYEALKTEDSEMIAKGSLVDQTKSDNPNDLGKKIFNTSKNPIASADDQARYLTIQVASLRDMTAADAMVKALKKKGYHEVYRSIGNVPGKGTWYRVRIGNFADETDAQKEMRRLKQDKYDPLLVKW